MSVFDVVVVVLHLFYTRFLFWISSVCWFVDGSVDGGVDDIDVAGGGGMVYEWTSSMHHFLFPFSFSDKLSDLILSI